MRKYLNHGFINIDIKEPRLYLSPDKRWIFIDIKIVEGAQYDLQSIDLDGDFIKPKEEIRNLIKAKINTTFNYEDVQKDIQRVTVFYQDAGYAYVNVIPKNKVDNEKLTVDLTFVIEKGPLVYIEKITIIGNDFTRDKVIRREIQIIEQDLYSITKIKQSEFFIRRLSYIKEVKVTETQGSKSDTMILTFEIEEQSRGTFQVGAAFNSVDSFMFQGTIQKTNLFGYGWSINFFTQLGSRSKIFSLNFIDPYFLDTDVSMSASAYNTYTRRLNFSEKRLGSALSFGYPIYKKIYRASLGYKFEDVGVANFNETRALLFKDGITSSSTVGISRDTRNKISFFETTEGSLSTAQSELAGSHALGGDNSFVKVSLEHRHFFQLFKESDIPLISDSNFQFRSRLGYVTSLTGDTIPIFERYFQGGLFSLRGFELSSIAPSIQVATSSDPDTLVDERFVIGGNKEVLFNVEYVLPILKEHGLKFVTFFDTGNTYNNGEMIDLRDLRYDLGFGIRWFTPIAPLTFEWGFPLDPKEGEDSFVFNFMLGTPF
jgi:outer membrane protein insertion porin family